MGRIKPFDLDKALNGEPVRLRNGRKAYVYCIIPNQFVDRSPFTLIGVILGKKIILLIIKLFGLKMVNIMLMEYLVILILWRCGNNGKTV